MNLSLPKFTIVTPSYNQAEFLDEALLSIQLQDYPACEHIVMDGGSTDASVALIERRSAGLNHWRSAKDEGQSDALRQGFERGTGSILGWINSDDALMPGALKAVGAYFATHPETDVLIGSVAYANVDGVITSCHSYEPLNPQLARGGAIAFAQQSMFFRRELYERLGGLRADFHFLMDTEFVYRMLREGAKFHTIRPVLGVFRWHSDMKSINRGGRKAEETALLFREYGIDPTRVVAAQRRHRLQRLIGGAYTSGLRLTLRFKGRTIRSIWERHLHSIGREWPAN